MPHTHVYLHNCPLSILFPHTAETLEKLEKWQKLAETDPALAKQKDKLREALKKEAARNRDAEVNKKKEEEKQIMAAQAGEDADPMAFLEEDTDIDERFSFVMKKDRMADADMKCVLL